MTKYCENLFLLQEKLYSILLELKFHLAKLLLKYGAHKSTSFYLDLSTFNSSHCTFRSFKRVLSANLKAFDFKVLLLFIFWKHLQELLLLRFYHLQTFYVLCHVHFTINRLRLFKALVFIRALLVYHNCYLQLKAIYWVHHLFFSAHLQAMPFQYQANLFNLPFDCLV